MANTQGEIVVQVDFAEVVSVDLTEYLGDRVDYRVQLHVDSEGHVSPHVDLGLYVGVYISLPEKLGVFFHDLGRLTVCQRAASTDFIDVVVGKLQLLRSVRVLVLA